MIFNCGDMKVRLWYLACKKNTTAFRSEPLSRHLSVRVSLMTNFKEFFSPENLSSSLVKQEL